MAAVYEDYACPDDSDDWEHVCARYFVLRILGRHGHWHYWPRLLIRDKRLCLDAFSDDLLQMLKSGQCRACTG